MPENCILAHHNKSDERYKTYFENNKIKVKLSGCERSGSGVELRTIDYENPGSNPGCGVKTLGKFFSLYIAPVHSAV